MQSNLRHIFLEGERIYLRALEEKDLLGNYYQWLNDQEVTLFNSHGRFPNNEKKIKDYFIFTQTASNALILAIIWKENDQHIGNISLQNINWIDRSAEFAILLGDKNYWGKNVGKEAGNLIIKHGFFALNLHRIYCGTSADNIAMQKLAQKLQMKQEGVRREAIFKSGKYVDIIEYGLLKNEYKHEIL
ncbi:MAG: GNAT family N-acetyltransferase [Raineya sp.]|nr:GNAT family N-acetyltransferase [Raineya sp.]